MIYNKVDFIVLINVILLQYYRNTVAYTQILTSANGGEDEAGPKIYKAVNLDLIFPKSFNSSENVISTTPESIPSPTKTATSVDGQPYYSWPQSNEPTTTHSLYTAATLAGTTAEKQQEPILFVTPTATTDPTLLAAASSNEAAGIYDAQQNMNSNKYTAQVVTQNAINMQQEQLPHQQQQQEEEEEEEQEQLSDNNNGNERKQQQYFATGRAVDYHTSYPFGQVITPLIKNAPRPVYRKPVVVTSYSTFSPSSSLSPASLAATRLRAAAPSNVGKIIYPQVMHQQKPLSQAEIDKLRGKAKFKDRFTPSEGVASHAFKSHNDHSSDHQHDHDNHAPAYKTAGKTLSASNVINSYVTPSNLYAFPPNNINYPAQAQDTKNAFPSGSLNSYSWPASGSLKTTDYNTNTAGSNSSPYQYNGPISAEYLSSANKGNNEGGMDEQKHNDSDGDIDNGTENDSVGVLPASAMDQGNGDGNGDTSDNVGGTDMDSIDSPDDKTPDDNSYDTNKEYPTPPPGWLKEHPESVQDHPPHDHQPKKPDIDFIPDHNYHHQADIVFDHEHEHNHDHHSFPSYPSYPIYHHHPEIMYDDHHHYHHPHIEHPPPIMTTAAPPPEPPPEPRVKKYSYFYIGRKLWYIPLYFTVWFSFYVLWLILKSIARHKVNLPNHYVSRRSVYNYDLSQGQQEIINQLTVSVLDKIDKFKRKLQ